MTPVPVTVAILTYRRPGEIQDGLPMVLEQVTAVNAADPDFSIDVLVVDNDPAGSARQVVERTGSELVRYRVEPRSGISAARNCAIDQSPAARLLIYLDDDERPEPRWLESLLSVWAVSRPAAVSGRVIPRYESPPDEWIVQGRFFQRRSLPTGTELDVAAAGNLLLDLDQIRALGLRFDDRFGLAGGEDTLFTRKLYAAGGRMLWCNESAAVDRVPNSRMTRAWALRRSWSHGNTTGLIKLEMTGSAAARRAMRVQLAGAGAGRMVVGTGRSWYGRLTRSPRHLARGQRLARRGGGMVAAAFGSVYQEYRRSG